MVLLNFSLECPVQAHMGPRVHIFSLVNDRDLSDID